MGCSYLTSPFLAWLPPVQKNDAHPPRSIFSQADALHQWGLAAPPLSELLQHLRQQGIAIPAETFTLEEAFVLLQRVLMERGNDGPVGVV